MDQVIEWKVATAPADASRMIRDWLEPTAARAASVSPDSSGLSGDTDAADAEEPDGREYTCAARLQYAVDLTGRDR
jgi:hypothetical protein